MRVFATTTKKVTCPGCGDPVAEVAYRPVPPSFDVTSMDGRRVTPLSGSMLLDITEQEVGSSTGPALQEATARREFIRRNSAELLFELRCPLGHVTVRTQPQLATAVRKFPGQWVAL